jgi:hypothetical protein
MALANLSWVLASAGRRVLLIDWDVEAPGLHRYLRPFLIDSELLSSEGLMDLVDEYASQAIRPVTKGETTDPDWYLRYADFTNHVLSVNYDHFPPGGKIDFIPAGRQGDAYAVKVASFNWQNLYDRLGGGAFFNAVKARAKSLYDYVLIDSRTGVSDTAGICSAQMADTLVVCFTYTNQSIYGAAAVARSARKLRAKLEEDWRRAKAAREGLASGLEDTPAPYRVFPVPMRCGRRSRATPSPTSSTTSTRRSRASTGEPSRSRTIRSTPTRRSWPRSRMTLATRSRSSPRSCACAATSRTAT